ncbi:MAG: hypothetical protein AAF805_00430 [Planctomycetota bacterium]
MARAYAGWLGTLGMAFTLLRGALAGGGFEGTVLQAVFALLALAVVGAVVGAIAEATVDEAVRTQLERQLAEHEGSQSDAKAAA